MSDRTRRAEGWRAAAFAVALFAITLNFLQPLAHAALLRDGSPSTLWSVFCKPMASERTDASGSVPASTVDHECCLGLAHAPALLAPSLAFILLPAAEPAPLPAPRIDQSGAAGIRDGPHRPRGPPSLLV
jgi:hypothetical protein